MSEREKLESLKGSLVTWCDGAIAFGPAMRRGNVGVTVIITVDDKDGYVVRCNRYYEHALPGGLGCRKICLNGREHMREADLGLAPHCSYANSSGLRIRALEKKVKSLI